MDLFYTLGALEIIVTLLLAALFGFKNFEFYWIWFGVIAWASLLIGVAWKLTDFWSLPNAGQVAFIAIAAINILLWLVSAVLFAGKASERLRNG